MSTRAVAAVGTVVASVAAAGALSAWAAAPPATATAAGARFAATDGTVAVFELTSTGGTTVLVQEHQRATGFDALSALPATFGAQVLGLIDEADLPSAELWRVTSRQLRDDRVGPQTTDVYRLTDDGVLRLGGVGGTYPTVFDPPLLVVPAEPRAGDRWDATGSALLDGALGYSFAAEVRNLDDEGCATIESTLELTMSGEQFSTIESSERWCPGRGFVGGGATFDELGTVSELAVTAVDDPVARLDELPRPTPGDADPASDPADWQPLHPALVARDGFFGDMPVDGVTALPPTVSSDGLVVATLVNGADLVALRLGPAPEGDPDPTPRLVEQWRAHPGGEVLAGRVLGDLIVVSTAERALVAYDLNGVRRWQATTDDLVLRGAVRVDDLIVAQDLSGRLTAWSAADGQVVWRAATRADSDLAPVVLGDDLVVAADRSGDLIGLAADSGALRWRRLYDGVDALGVVGEQVVVDTVSGTVHAVDRTGAERWTTEVDVWLARIDDVGGRIGLLGSDESTVLDPATGRVDWTLPSGDSADGLPTGLAVHRRDEVCLYDTDGTEVRCWPLDTVSEAVRIFLVATPAGLWALDGSLDALVIGPPAGPGQVSP